MSDNIDSHGVTRGNCEVCDCTLFLKSDDNIKCKNCKHAPVRHKALGPAPSQPATPPSQPQPVMTPAVTHQVPQPPMPQNAQMSTPHMQQTVPPNYNPQFYPQQVPTTPQYIQMPPPIPPDHSQCATCHCLFPDSLGACFVCFPREVCTICKSVPRYIDMNLPEDIRVFNYCSPECRNKDLPRLDKEAGISQETA